MVEDTGKALRPGTNQPVTGAPNYKPETGSQSTYKPVNLPIPVKVEETISGRPAAIRGKTRMPVMTIEDCWRIDDEWWRADPVSRIYYNLLLTSGRRLVLYKDLVKGDWYEQEY